MRTLDQNGNIVDDSSKTRGLGAAADSYSFGASLFEFLNPSTVQAEQVAIGQTPSTTGQIMTDAVSNAITAGQESISNVEQSAQRLASSALDMGKVLLIGGAIAVIIALTRGK